ncbi:MAG: hypothetical protein WBV51_20195, partial [Pseudolabrys sp.]
VSQFLGILLPDLFEISVFRPFLLDLAGSRRYIPTTFRQAVSFACSERPPASPLRALRFLENWLAHRLDE